MHSLAELHPLICVQWFVGGRELPGYVHGKEGDGLTEDTENSLVEKENQNISNFDQHFVEIMFCRIHFLHEIPLNLSKINRKGFISRFDVAFVSWRGSYEK